MLLTTSISVFVNVAQMPPFCILPCSRLHGHIWGRVDTKHDSPAASHETAVKVTQGRPAGPVPDSGIRDTACGRSLV